MQKIDNIIKNTIFIEKNQLDGLSITPIYETDDISEYRLSLNFEETRTVKNLKLKITS